jgi:signal peptidase I
MFMLYQKAVRSFDAVVVPEGKYFMMGDNRDNSQDSRYFGFVDRKMILGRAIAIVLSLDYERNYLPRTDRFFKKLQ